MTTARAFLLLQAAALCGLLLCARAPAQQPPSRLQEQYTHTAWSALDNAPVDILNIAQTSDGWLWLAAGTGLFRFDGRRYDITGGGGWAAAEGYYTMSFAGVGA